MTKIYFIRGSLVVPMQTMLLVLQSFRVLLTPLAYIHVGKDAEMQKYYCNA